jgi:hypothetical protein
MYPGDNLVITLTPCTGIRRLDLVFQEDCDLDMAITALHVLSCLRSRDLAIVNLLDKRHRRNMTPSWRRLDTKLAEEQFAGLQAFTVESKSPSLVAGLPRNMPLSTGRGILRVVDPR